MSWPSTISKYLSDLGNPVHGVAKLYGEVAEWLMAPVLKTGVPERVPGVRIPPSPPVPYLVLRLPLLARKAAPFHHRRLHSSQPRGRPEPLIAGNF
jgi:hypothetical protein